MKVPLLDLQPQLDLLGSEIKEAVLKVIDSKSYIMGPEVQELESAIAKYCGTSFAVGVSSGTDALLAALMALDVGANDIVITTPYSFFASAGVVARLGATPAMVDIDAATYNMSPELLEKWFLENPDKIEHVKAIMPIHLYGQCADMDGILKVAHEYEVPVIEDAAQAIGASYPGVEGTQRAGAMGVMGCFSFFPSKNLGCLGDGGIITTNHEEVASKLKMLRNHGAEPKYYHSIIGANFRLDTIQAASLLVKLPHLDSWHEQRRENAHYYDENLNVSEIERPKLAYGREHHIYNQYIISVKSRRNELRQFLLDNDIGCEIYYPVPFHQQECFKYLGHKKGDYPNSEYAADHTLALPIYPELTREMQNYVISKITEYFA